MRTTDTKERLIKAALDLFSEKGYEGTGVDQIAKAVGIKAPSIYAHFKGKEELLEAVTLWADEEYAKGMGTKEDAGKNVRTGKKLLVALFFSVSLIFLEIFLGFFIKYLYLGIAQQDNDLLDEALIGFVFSLIVGLIFFITLAILLRDYDRNKKEKNIKWYIDYSEYCFICLK